MVLSRRLDVAARIARQTPRAQLDREIGRDAIRSLMASLGATLLACERLLAAAREVLGLAAEAGVPVVVVKGMALLLLGHAAVGSRGASDVDVLVAEEDLARLAEALARKGFRSESGGPRCEHQLPAFHRGPGESVELHRHLPGVRLPGGRSFVTARDLEAGGLLQPLHDSAGRAFTPALPVLMAHASVHGIAQHGFAPQGYPLMRMVADLVDLGVGTQAGLASWREALALTAGYVRESEADGLWELCRRLRDGGDTPEVLMPERSPADALLAHIVAGALDPVYGDSLKLRVLGSTPSLLPRPIAWVLDAARSLWPTDAQLRGLNPGRRSRAALIGARALRPFVQARRAVRSAWSALRVQSAVRAR